MTTIQILTNLSSLAAMAVAALSIYYARRAIAAARRAEAARRRQEAAVRVLGRNLGRGGTDG